MGQTVDRFENGESFKATSSDAAVARLRRLAGLADTTMAQKTTTGMPPDQTATGVDLIISFGIVLLVLVFIPYALRFGYFVCKVVCGGETWVWDSVSLSCAEGKGTYILAIICSYTAMYLTSMYTLEYASHYNTTWDTVCFILDIVGNLCLCCLGIFPSSFKCSCRCVVHGIAGFLFFAITNATNLRWAFNCECLVGMAWCSELVGCCLFWSVCTLPISATSALLSASVF